MSQRQQLERILTIDHCIRNGGYPNADRLAEQLEVSRRVIFTDREFMISRMGAPIEFDHEHGGWRYTDDTWVLPAIIVTEGELLAFFVSLEAAKRYLGTAFEAALRSGIEKISKTVTGPVTVDLESLRSYYSFAAPTLLSANEQALLNLHTAISQHRQVWMRYYTASRDEHTERTVHPYHLSNIRGDWYLIAYDELREDFRNFSVGRIEEWRILSDQFRRDPKFSITQYMGTAFQAERGGEPVEVVIRFAPPTARYIREKQWHESQQIEEQEDGGLVLRLWTGGLGELKRWVLQYGGDAEVIMPAVLRKEISREIQRMSVVYRANRHA